MPMFLLLFMSRASQLSYRRHHKVNNALILRVYHRSASIAEPVAAEAAADAAEMWAEHVHTGNGDDDDDAVSDASSDSFFEEERPDLDDDESDDEDEAPTAAQAQSDSNQPATTSIDGGSNDEDDKDKQEMYDTMRKLLVNASPEKQSLFLQAAPIMAEKLHLTGQLNTSIVSNKSSKGAVVESAESVFQRLEKTRAFLEQTLGEDVFFEAYRLLRDLQESDDDDVTSEAATKARIDSLLAGEHQKHYQTLLHLVISDCTHFEANRSSEVVAEAHEELTDELDDFDFSDEGSDDDGVAPEEQQQQSSDVNTEDVVDKYAAKEIAVGHGATTCCCFSNNLIFFVTQLLLMQSRTQPWPRSPSRKMCRLATRQCGTRCPSRPII